jgi:hypothetical protein
MDLLSSAGQLDGELKIPTHPENLIEWAVTETNRPLINPEFLDRKTGLLLRGSTQVERVYTSVFASDMIVKKLFGCI